MPLTMIGVGPHGYDFLVGRWKCNESAQFQGKWAPKAFMFKIELLGEGSLSLLWSAKLVPVKNVVTFDYLSEIKTWSASAAYFDGTRASETTTDTGQKTVWTGSELNPRSQKTFDRDTWTFPSLDEFTDVAEQQIGGTWTVVGNSTCRRSG